MRIIIPTNGSGGLDEPVAQHFGRCQTYTLLDGQGKVLQVIDNTSTHMGGDGLPPELMKKHGADVLLCRGIGPRAMALCRELGIDVYVSNAGTVKEIFGQWKDKGIKKAGLSDVCEEHRE
jgi:predicted Fe-Mo cluster-binding NifX family protein